MRWAGGVRRAGARHRQGGVAAAGGPPTAGEESQDEPLVSGDDGEDLLQEQLHSVLDTLSEREAGWCPCGSG